MVFNDDAMPPVEGAVRSPTEYLERRREREQRQGMPYIRFVEEVARPVLRAGTYLLGEAGELPELAAVQPALADGSPAPLMMNGRDVALKFRSPLVLAQELAEAEGIVRWGQFSIQTAGMEAWQAGVYTEDIPATLAHMMGVPGALVRSEAERRDLAEEAATARMQGSPPANAPQPMQQAPE